MSKAISVKGIENVAKFIEAVANDDVQILVSVDSYQIDKHGAKDAYYSVEVAYVNDGECFSHNHE